MRRADRLFQIIQILRRSSRPVTAQEMAQELEVSPRTVYRDIADLIGQRVPVQGEAGFGYILEDSFDMPPLMLTPEEIEAAVLGAQWVMGRGDPALAGAARDLIAKITSVVPEHLRTVIAHPTIGVPPFPAPVPDSIDLARTRLWIREGRKLAMTYRDEKGTHSERIIWPVILGYFEATRILAGWCEMRQDFRHFRTDRIVTLRFLEDHHGLRPGELKQRWKRKISSDPYKPPAPAR